MYKLMYCFYYLSCQLWTAAKIGLEHITTRQSSLSTFDDSYNLISYAVVLLVESTWAKKNLQQIALRISSPPSKTKLVTPVHISSQKKWKKYSFSCLIRKKMTWTITISLIIAIYLPYYAMQSHLLFKKGGLLQLKFAVTVGVNISLWAW